MRKRKEGISYHTTNVGERERERKKEKNYFDPHMVVVETTIINVLSLKRDLHIYMKSFQGSSQMAKIFKRMRSYHLLQII
jgi:hypothetical protein